MFDEVDNGQVSQSDVLFQIEAFSEVLGMYDDEKIVEIAQKHLLEEMPEIDISSSLAYFFSTGALSNKHRKVIQHYIISVELPVYLSENGRIYLDKRASKWKKLAL